MAFDVWAGVVCGSDMAIVELIWRVMSIFKVSLVGFACEVMGLMW